jgi:hypothetical protein
MNMSDLAAIVPEPHPVAAVIDNDSSLVWYIGRWLPADQLCEVVAKATTGERATFRRVDGLDPGEQGYMVYDATDLVETALVRTGPFLGAFRRAG